MFFTIPNKVRLARCPDAPIDPTAPVQYALELHFTAAIWIRIKFVKFSNGHKTRTHMKTKQICSNFKWWQVRVWIPKPCLFGIRIIFAFGCSVSRSWENLDFSVSSFVLNVFNLKFFFFLSLTVMNVNKFPHKTIPQPTLVNWFPQTKVMVFPNSVSTWAIWLVCCYF